MRPVTTTTGPVAWLAIIASTGVTLYLFRKILWLIIPFFLALTLFYLLKPFSRRLIVRGMSPEMAAFLPSAVFLALIGIGFLLLYPVMLAKADRWPALIQHYLLAGSLALESTLRALQQKIPLLDWLRLDETFHKNLLAFSAHFTQRQLGQVFASLAAWLPSLLLTPIIAYFLLKDGQRLRQFMGRAVPNAYFEKTLHLMHTLDRTAQQYFQGMITILLLDALILITGLAALGLPAPVVLGSIAALLGLIPYLGPLLGGILCILIAAADFPGNSQLIYSIIGLFVGLRLWDDFVVFPWLMGKGLNLHPLLILLMFFIGEAIAGVAGLMLVIPLLAAFAVIGGTVSDVLGDQRLRARHRHAQRLRRQLVEQDLNLP
jgi:predicted PurR-regulated permease PerM